MQRKSQIKLFFVAFTLLDWRRRYNINMIFLLLNKILFFFAGVKSACIKKNSACVKKLNETFVIFISIQSIYIKKRQNESENFNRKGLIRDAYIETKIKFKNKKNNKNLHKL